MALSTASLTDAEVTLKMPHATFRRCTDNNYEPLCVDLKNPSRAGTRYRHVLVRQ